MSAERDGMDLLIALPVEKLQRAAQMLSGISKMEQIHSHLNQLSKQRFIHQYVDHIWLELDQDHPEQFSTFLGYPGNVQQDNERIAMLDLVAKCLINQELNGSSYHALKLILEYLKTSRLLKQINAGGHIISEVGWMNRMEQSHLKLLITPGYRRSPLDLLSNLFDANMQTMIKEQIIRPLSTIEEPETDPLNIHVSVAVDLDGTRAAVEVSHTPTQNSFRFDTDFCKKIQHFSGQGTQMMPLFQRIKSIQKQSVGKGVRLQLSHLKVSVETEPSSAYKKKIYVRVLTED
jgi:hypothetical protein